MEKGGLGVLWLLRYRFSGAGFRWHWLGYSLLWFTCILHLAKAYELADFGGLHEVDGFDFNGHNCIPRKEYQVGWASGGMLCFHLLVFLHLAKAYQWVDFGGLQEADEV